MLLWDDFGHFLTKIGENEFSWKKTQFSGCQLSAIMQKKQENYWPIPKKNAALTDGQTNRQPASKTDRQTDKQWF